MRCWLTDWEGAEQDGGPLWKEGRFRVIPTYTGDLIVSGLTEAEILLQRASNDSLEHLVEEPGFDGTGLKMRMIMKASRGEKGIIIFMKMKSEALEIISKCAPSEEFRSP
nr:hypothetical protein RTCK_02943 [Rhizobium sp. TCK]